MWYWKRMEKIKWSENVTNKEVLKHIGKKRALLISCIQKIGHILRRNCLLHDAIEGQMI
jgi:hypothetical protein